MAARCFLPGTGVADHPRACRLERVHVLRQERPDHTLGTTALVHEAYLKLVDQTRAQWADRTQFFAIASRAMRRILVDYARQHLAGKRGGRRERGTLGRDR